MKKKGSIRMLAAAFGMMILILDSKTALTGAAEGIELCIRTLVPSLFPFFVIGVFLTGSMIGQDIRLLRPVGKLCSVPKGAESLLAVGFLGGYPVGAQNVAYAWRRGQLSRSDAQRMLVFCNNAGPSFLFGMIAPMFSDVRIVWLLWGIHIASALLVGLAIPASPGNHAAMKASDAVSLSAALEKSVKTMALVCGWVILFRILLTFLERWLFWLFPDVLPVVISGILELSNGCVQLGSIACEGQRFLIAGVLLAIGGVCVTMQTASVSSGLSMKLYFPGKILQGCFAFLLSSACQLLFPAQERWAAAPVFILLISGLTVFLVMVLRKSQKSSSIPAAVGV